MTGWGVLRGVGVSQKGGEGTPYATARSGHARLLRPPLSVSLAPGTAAAAPAPVGVAFAGARHAQQTRRRVPRGAARPPSRQEGPAAAAEAAAPCD